jgi:hypothetical protein
MEFRCEHAIETFEFHYVLRTLLLLLLGSALSLPIMQEGGVGGGVPSRQKVGVRCRIDGNFWWKPLLFNKA